MLSTAGNVLVLYCRTRSTSLPVRFRSIVSALHRERASPRGSLLAIPLQFLDLLIGGSRTVQQNVFGKQDAGNRAKTARLRRLCSVKFFSRSAWSKRAFQLILSARRLGGGRRRVGCVAHRSRGARCTSNRLRLPKRSLAPVGIGAASPCPGRLRQAAFAPT